MILHTGHTLYTFLNGFRAAIWLAIAIAFFYVAWRMGRNKK